MLFVDESGTPPNKPGRQKYFVLGGLVIPEAVWHQVEKELDVAKAAFNVTGEIKWRFFSPHNKDFDNSISHLNEQQRNLFRDKLFRIITSRKSLKIISVVASVDASYDLEAIQNSDDLYQFAYKPLTERFQYFLQDMQRDSGQKTCGIIVCDHRGPRDDKRLQELHQRLIHQDGLYSSSYQNLIEGLFIAPSHWSVGIQLADLVAGAIYRNFESGDDRFFKKLLGSFRARGAIIEGVGLVKQPRKHWR